MLTKDDLQAIRGIVKEEVPSIVRDEVNQQLKKELKKELKPIHQQLSTQDKKINQKFDILDKKINQGFDTLEKKLDLVIHVFDNDIIDHEKRITQLEKRGALHSSVN